MPIYHVKHPKFRQSLTFRFIFNPYPNIMWKAILQGEKIAQGDTIRYQPSSSNLPYQTNVYQVVKTEQHYFEIVIKPDKENTGEYLNRKIVKYIDIGYHLWLEVWAESVQVLSGHPQEKLKAY